MSILIDVNQIVFGVLVSNFQHNSTPDINLIRHSIISRFLDIHIRFSEIYGDIVLCYDSNKYWRKGFFINYKSSRKEDRQKSSINWQELFDLSNILKNEFSKYLPYKLLCIDNAEADDIIAVLCKNNISNNSYNLIVSGDKDFKQLQKSKNTHIYNPQTQKLIYANPDEACLYLKEHIIRGDRSDGIPNILSPDNSFVDNIRQKPITKKNIEKWIVQKDLDICAESTDIQYNYNRNQILIDFDYIPKELSQLILNIFNNYVHMFKKHSMFKYFSDCGLTEITRKYSKIYV